MRHRLRALAIIVTASLVLECGTGRAIFDIDVLSFLGGGGNDVVPYRFTSNGQVQAPPIRVSLLKGLGKSTVSGVSLIVGATGVADSGAGTLVYDVHFAGSTANLYADTACAVGSFCVKQSKTFTAGDSAAFPLDSIPLAADSIFGNDSIFVGVRVAATPTATPFKGRLRLTTVRLLIVLQDNLFQ